MDSENHWTAEGRDKITKMAPAKFSLATRPEAYDTLVLNKHLSLKHVTQDGPSIDTVYLIRSSAEPSINGEDMSRSRWRNHRLDNALAPKGDYRKSGQKLFVIGCKKEAIAPATNSTPSAPHSL
jgi:hypothetical protein